MQVRRISRWIGALTIVMALIGLRPPAKTEAATYNWPTLRYGDINEDVVTLQAFLRRKGYNAVVYTGEYEDTTYAAVQQVERLNGLLVDGIADSDVWEKVYVTVRQGDTNIVVNALQRQLRNTQGYTKTVSSVDSVFGQGTYNAVTSFQKSVNLSVDGVVGLTSWAALVNSSPYRITHGQARAQLYNAGIAVTSSLGSTGVGSDRVADKTSLEQIRSNTITGLIAFKNASGCAITVTGGTETWIHQGGLPGHHTGHKIDIDITSCVTSYIQRTYTQIDSARWKDANNNIYYNEGDHWDILYR